MLRLRTLVAYFFMCPFTEPFVGGEETLLRSNAAPRDGDPPTEPPSTGTLAATPFAFAVEPDYAFATDSAMPRLAMLTKSGRHGQGSPGGLRGGAPRHRALSWAGSWNKPNRTGALVALGGASYTFTAFWAGGLLLVAGQPLLQEGGGPAWLSPQGSSSSGTLLESGFLDVVHLSVPYIGIALDMAQVRACVHCHNSWIYVIENHTDTV